MLTETSEPSGTAAAATLQGGLAIANSTEPKMATPVPQRSRLARAFRIEWLGQTVASLCWIASVLIYGGDWLQLAAASAWLLANLAALASEVE